MQEVALWVALFILASTCAPRGLHATRSERNDSVMEAEINEVDMELFIG